MILFELREGYLAKNKFLQKKLYCRTDLNTIPSFNWGLFSLYPGNGLARSLELQFTAFGKRSGSFCIDGDVMDRAKKRFFTNHAKSDAVELRGVFYIVLFVFALSFVMVPVIRSTDNLFEASFLTRSQRSEFIGFKREIMPSAGWLKVK